MMPISLAGLLGAIAGTVLAAVVYHLFIDRLDRTIRKWAQPASAQDHAGFEVTMALVRRLVLIVELAVFAAAGYWAARELWD